MTVTVLPTEASLADLTKRIGASGFLSAMEKLDRVLGGLNGLSVLNDIASEAQTAACAIESAINAYRAPSRDELEHALKVFDRCEEIFEGSLTRAGVKRDVSRASGALSFLLGHLVDGGDGDIYTPETAPKGAISEAIV